MSVLPHRLRVLTAVEPGLGLAELAPLLHDLYIEPGPHDVRVLLAPATPATWPGAAALGHNVSALPIDETTWTQNLATALTRHGADAAVDLVHCPQLGTPIVKALVEAIPRAPRIGIVTAADLRRARTDQAGIAALQRDARAMHILAVPSGPITDVLLDCAPGIDPDRLAAIPFPVPDHLIDTPPLYSRATGRPRILFAGPTTDHNAVKSLLLACKRAGAELTMAVTSQGLHATHQLVRSCGVFPAVLHDLSREKLWELFGTVDAVAVLDGGPLAFSRTALEAHARGVPAICQLGSGMAAMLPGAVNVDFADPSKAAEVITTACTDPTLLGKLRTDARAGMKPHRLSTVRALLAELGTDLLLAHQPADTPTSTPTEAADSQ